ncbi:MAG: hypothetical protein GY755_15005 [Chloroflexi bacterium]|nr:hypothetical protein [Chloroflexota bacterium]
MNAKTTKTEMKKPEASTPTASVIANINGVNVENATVLKYQESNPKRAGSKAHQRFELYMKAKTVAEFLKLGGLKADLRYDADKGFVEIAPK